MHIQNVLVHRHISIILFKIHNNKIDRFNKFYCGNGSNVELYEFKVDCIERHSDRSDERKTISIG